MATQSDVNYFKLNYQTGNFDVSRRPGAPTVIDALAFPEASAKTAQDITLIERRDDEYAKFEDGEEQYKGVFVSDDAGTFNP